MTQAQDVWGRRAERLAFATSGQAVVCHPQRLTADALVRGLTRAMVVAHGVAVTTIDEVMHGLRRPTRLVLVADLADDDVEELFEALRYRGCSAPVVTAYRRPELVRVVDDLERGANGVLDLDSPQNAAAASLSVVMSGGTAIPDELEVAVVRELARRLAVRSRSRQVLGTLTPREREVLDLLVTGTRRREIAALLGCSVHTARTHIDRIRSKLGAATQVQAVAIGHRLLADVRATRSPGVDPAATPADARAVVPVHTVGSVMATLGVTG